MNAIYYAIGDIIHIERNETQPYIISWRLAFEKDQLCLMRKKNLKCLIIMTTKVFEFLGVNKIKLGLLFNIVHRTTNYIFQCTQNFFHNFHFIKKLVSVAPCGAKMWNSHVS